MTILQVDKDWVNSNVSDWTGYRDERPFHVQNGEKHYLISFMGKKDAGSRVKDVLKAFDRCILPGGNVPEPCYFQSNEGWLCIEEYSLSMLEGYNCKAFSLLNAERQERVMLGAARALQTLHWAGLVHGSLDYNSFRVQKAADENFRVILSGFAFTDLADNKIETGYPRGYQAPEVRFRRNITQKTDVYALGVCFYFWLTNQLPAKNEEGELLVPHSMPKYVCSLISDMLIDDEIGRIDSEKVVDRLKSKFSSDRMRYKIFFQNDRQMENNREYYDTLREQNTWLK